MEKKFSHNLVDANMHAESKKDTEYSYAEQEAYEEGKIMARSLLEQAYASREVVGSGSVRVSDEQLAELTMVYAGSLDVPPAPEELPSILAAFQQGAIDTFEQGYRQDN